MVTPPDGGYFFFAAFAAAFFFGAAFLTTFLDAAAAVLNFFLIRLAVAAPLFMGALQQISFSMVAQPHASSTVRMSPHTSQLSLSPFFDVAMTASFQIVVRFSCISRSLTERIPLPVFPVYELSKKFQLKLCGRAVLRVRIKT